MSMSAFIIYDRETGEIVRSGTCQTHMVLKQPRESGQAVMLGNLPSHQQASKRIKLINGKPCIVSKPPPPAAQPDAT